jgi:hypothetical protein
MSRIEVTRVEPSFPDGDLIIRSEEQPTYYHRAHLAILQHQPTVFTPAILAGRENIGIDGLCRITMLEHLEEVTARVFIAYYSRRSHNA